ncbi:MAG: pyruvate formate lyase-activating protein [Lachnospiraceae bacterium]|nr:pyruvate formate lyase-activating protein [Lachnospiraceae bacterium]
MSNKGYIHSFESFALVDGPGVRYCIFLQGCNMRCRYCHNPDTWKTGCGEEWEAQKLFDKVYRYKTYWKNNGGITVSGGEALLQMDFVTEFFEIAKSKGVNTCLDTSGNPFEMTPEYLEKFDRLMKVTDLFMLDLKEMDDEKHKDLTGCSNKNILEMAKYLSDNNKDMWIRRVLVPGLTDDEKDLKDTADFIKTLNSVKKVEILPYHTLGVQKWKDLGIKYSLDDFDPPTDEEVKKAKDILGID